MTVITIPIGDSAHDVSTTEGGPFNQEHAGGNLHHGTHKSGQAERPHVRFDNLNIPPTSVINSASIELEAVVLGAGILPIPSQVRLLAKDGLWNAQPNVPDQWTNTDSDDDWKVELLDVATQLVAVGFGSAPGGGPAIRGNSGDILKKIAQGVTIVSAGDITTARVSLGNVSISGSTGNVWIELYSDASGLPDTLLATSDTRPISDFPFLIPLQVHPDFDFTFTGAEIITVAISDDIHVVVASDGSSPSGQLVRLGAMAYNYLPGDFAPFGESPNGGFDQQNYFTIDDLYGIATVGAVIPWTVTMTLGFQTTPDLSSQVQTAIDAGGYLYTDPIGFRLERTAPGTGSNIIWAAIDRTVGREAELTVDFTPPALLTIPDVVGLAQAVAELAIVAAGFTVGAVTFANSDTVPVGDVISQDPLGGTMSAPFTLVDIVVSLGPGGADKMADPYSGPSRFNEPFDRGYYLWKYGKPGQVAIYQGTEPDPEPARPEIARELLLDELRETRSKNALDREQRRLEAEAARAERDAKELQLYIAELTRELESDLLQRLNDQQVEQDRQQALIARLEENRVAARDALLLVLERQRRQRNQLTAVEESLRFFY